MLKVGVAPFLECSTKGDKRFSAFCAVVNGKSIEAQYQAFKIFPDGTTGLDWRAAKGRKAINMTEAKDLYISLWRQYLIEHSELVPILKSASGLSDMFGKPGCLCQASVLWELRNEF